MSRVLTIDADDLRDVIRQETIKAMLEVVYQLRDGEAIISAMELERNREMAKERANQQDVLLNGTEVAKMLGCTTGCITKMRNRGVLEATYPFKTGRAMYSRNKILKLIANRTIPTFKK
jgi:hypothetical protein